MQSPISSLHFNYANLPRSISTNRAPRAWTVRSVSHSETSRSNDGYEFTYEGSDGRRKATFEQAFKSGIPTKSADTPPAPWEFGYQMSEKNLVWNDDLKSRLLSRVAAEKLNLTEDELGSRLEQLQALLPDIKSKLPSMSPSTVIGLVQHVGALPQNLMALKAIFPGANASRLAVRNPQLVLGFDSDHLDALAAQLREMLPSVDVDKLLEENPSILDVEELRVAMAEAARIMPKLDVMSAMRTDPQLILSFQRGSQLIPYDPPIPQEDDDDEYAQYYK